MRVLGLLVLVILSLLPAIPEPYLTTVTSPQVGWPSQPKQITNDGLLHFNPSVAQDSKGTVYLFWGGDPAINYTITNTTNIANNIWPSAVSFIKGQPNYTPSVVALRNGTIILFYASPRGGNWDIYEARYNNGQWSLESRFTNSPAEDKSPTAIQDGFGKIWVAWTRIENSDLKLRFADLNGNGVWDPGEPIVYDSDNNGVYTTGRFHNDTVITGRAPANNTLLSNDPRIRFFDINNNGVWDPGEFVIYDPNQGAVYSPRIKYVDSNHDNIWDPGETLVYDANSDGLFNSQPGSGICTLASPSTDCVIVGAVPSNNTALSIDPLVKFVDPDRDGAWQPGDRLIYDRNNNGLYDAGEPIITPILLTNDPKLKFVGPQATWTPGNSVVYDVRLTGTYDSRIKFVDTNGNGHWDPGETVVSDSKLSGRYDQYTIPIFERLPGADSGKALKNDPSLKFIDTNGNGAWNLGEPVVYDSQNTLYYRSLKFVDTNGSGHWEPGKAVVYDTDNNGFYTTGRFHNDTLIAGPAPANNTALSTDPKIKFADLNANGIWDPGEPVVYDANNNGLYDAETTIASTTPSPGTPLRADPKIMFVNSTNTDTWAPRKTVIYDSDGNGLYTTGKFHNDTVIYGVAPTNNTKTKNDPRIMFVNATTSPAETWALGKAVVYDSDGNNRYDAELVIAGQAPAPGTVVSQGVGETLVAGASPSLGVSVRTDPRIMFVDTYPYNGLWDPANSTATGENIVYNINIDPNNSTYNPADLTIFSNGTRPAPGARLTRDPHVKFVNATTSLGEAWSLGKAVVYDSNLNNVFDDLDLVIQGSNPPSGSLLMISIGDPVVAGPTPLGGTSLKSDPRIRFVDQNGNGIWDPGEPVAYDSNNNGILDAGDIQIAGNPAPSPGTPLKTDEITLYGITVSTGTQLSADTKIKFVDTNNNGVWDQNETVVYDSDGNGLYTQGKFHNDTIIAGSAPANNTALKSDPRLKYVESQFPSDSHWEIGETVTYDTNSNNRFDPGEPVIAVFPSPSPGTTLRTDPKIKFYDPDRNGIWEPGEPVIYDTNNNGLYDTGDLTLSGQPPTLNSFLVTDSHIKFVDSNGDLSWEQGEAIVYDSNSNSLYDSGERVIAGGAPVAGTPLRGVSHVFYRIFNGVSWSVEQRLTSQPSNDTTPHIAQTEDGRVWMIWVGDRSAPSEILYRTTMDGVVWTSEVRAYTDPSPNPKGDKDPTISQDRNGTVIIVWAHYIACSCGTSTFQADLYSTNSTDNGVHWSVPVDLTLNCTGCSTTNEIEPTIVQLSDKQLYIFFPIVSVGASSFTVNLYYLSNLILIHDASINGLSASTLNLRVGQTLTIKANVTNTGDFNDTMTTTVMANSTLIATNTTLVKVGQTVQIIVNWIVKVKPGQYVLTATVNDPGEGLANQIDNTATISGVLFRPVGDVNGDCTVNIVDLVIVASSFGKSVGMPGYNPIADVNGDGIVNIADLSLVGSSFGQTC